MKLGIVLKKWSCVWMGVCATLVFLVSPPVLAQQASLVTGISLEAGNDDSLFKQPYLDVDEWRDTPVRHRYIHGGFHGTETRFSFYFPDKSQYQGRFFQHITPIPDSENLAQRVPAGEFNKIGFAIASGAYFIETNGGGAFDLGRRKFTNDRTISAYRANAAAARFSRIVAAEIYGRQHRPYGYAYGGSGGAYRTIGSIENTTGVWDGVVPYVIGSTMAIPNVFTVRMHAMRVLKDKFPQIVDAIEPGGSGNPYIGLNDEEREALLEATRMGFPLQAWFGYKTMGIQGFVALYEGIRAADPAYFTDFWTAPGYQGANPPVSLRNARIQHATRIAAPINRTGAIRLGAVSAETRGGGVDTAFQLSAPPVAFRLASIPPQIDFMGGDLIIKSGAAAGKRVMLTHLDGDVVVVGIADPDVLAKIRPGDEVEVDNSNFLAVSTYHRHQVPGRDFQVWDQFRDADGRPIYPQRPILLGPLFVKATAGSLMTGKFEGKMIVVESLWDREAMPWQADWYRNRVKEHLGARTDDNFRLWYTDHALHGDESGVEDPSRIVSYNGILHQALRDLSAWVERGIAPPASTNYKILDGQVVIPSAATERRGIQPVVTLTANGGGRADVEVGASILFAAVAEAPPGAGKIIAAQWDMEGIGSFPTTVEVQKPFKNRIEIKTSHTFSKPGTYFPVLRVVSQRDGENETPYARLQNLGRVRVVVR